MAIIYYGSIAVLSAFALLLFGAWRVLTWTWWKPKKLEKLLREQGLKGNPYRILYGDLKDMGALLKEAYSKPIGLSDDIVPRVIPHYHKIVHSHGKKSYMWFGPRPMVVINEPELIREVTQKIYLFEKPHTNPYTKLLAEGVFSYEGDKWAKHRKIINPAFHLEKLKDMLPAFHASAGDMLSKWEEIVSQEGSCEVDVWPYLETLTCDVISRTAFGSNYEKGRKIFEFQREQAEHLIKAVQSVYIPGWRFLPTKRNRRMKEICKTVNDTIKSIINARIMAVREGEAYGNDLLGILLESSSKEIDEHGNKNFGLTTREVIEECKLFYFAGQETTSVLLVWTMVLLSIHPHWQIRAREEIFQLFGTSKPDFDGLNHLKIVTMILYEVLRLYPPLTVLTRRLAEDTKLGNLTLAAGMLLALPVMLLHHDPEIWGDDVKDFKPERFAEGVSVATKGQVTFFPFGWGPRICIGQNFAMLEAKMAMVTILQKFSFELSPSYSHAPRAIVTLQPQHGAHLVLHKL